MRRIDRLNKEEIVEFFVTDCDECEAKNICIGANCDDAKKQYLTTEIQTKSRWELCKTDEDFIKLVDEAMLFCDSTDCDDCRLYEECDKHNSEQCIKAYGTEKVEVEE